MDKMSSKKQYPCPYCGRDTHGSGVTAGQGQIACDLCWEQNHPFVLATRIDDLERSSGDPQLGRQLLLNRLTRQQKNEAIEEYNAVMSQRYCENLNRLIDYRQEEEEK